MSRTNCTTDCSCPRLPCALVCLSINFQMDGFVWSALTSGGLPMSYWNLTGSALYKLASNYTLFDNFFGSALGGPLLAHIYLVGGQSVQWDNGNSQPPLILQDNATYTYHNYNTSNGILLDMNQEGILTYPDNYLVNNIHSPYFCGPPFFPYINDASKGTGPANLPDQLLTAGVSWAYYTQDWYNEEVDANSSVTDTCKLIGNDKKMFVSHTNTAILSRIGMPTACDSLSRSFAFFPRCQER